MSSKFFQFKKNLFLAILLLVIFALPKNVLAENLLTVGSASSSLSGIDSAIFSNIGGSSATTTSLIRLQKNGSDLFRVDAMGNVTTGSFLSTISAGNITPGAFNSVLNTGGDFSFPANVGIGTMTPAARLNIYSTSSIEEMFRLSDASGSSAANKYINWYSNNGGTTLTDFARIGAGYGSDYINSFMAFSVADGARVLRERVRINVNGNVGIGTTNPVGKLDVVGSLATFRIETTGDTFSWVGNGTKYIKSGSGNGLIFQANDGSRNDVIISPSGNVGIGNPSPGYKLDVNGEANFGIGTTTNRLHNVSAPTYGTDAANKNYVDSAITPPATTTAGIQSGFWTTGANGSIFNNNSSGKVGIGVTNPGAKFDLFSGTNSIDNSAAIGTGIRIGSGSGSKVDTYLNFWSTAGTLSTSYGASRIRSGWELSGSTAWNNSYIAFQTHGANSGAWTDDMIIKAGNVGIGTTTPGSLLTVGNNFGLTSGGIIFNSNSTRWLDMTGINADSLRVPGNLNSTAGILKIDGTGNSYVMGNLGIGTTNPAGKLHLEGGDLFLSNGNYYNSAGPRYGGKISLFSGLKGRQVNDNPDFLEGLNGYTIYDNNGSGTISRSLELDSTAPNSSGRVMRLSVSAAGAGPGLGGFYKATPMCSGTAVGHCLRQGNRHVVRIWAKIPVGFSIQYATNSMGTGGSFQWISSRAGTGNWEEYIGQETMGAGASTTNFFYVADGSAPLTWDVASVEIIDIDSVADVDRATSLNVGYKNDVVLGNGNILSTAGSYFAVDGGSVGVGTASPGAKLDVVGAFRASSATISLLGNSGNRIVMTDNAGNIYATSTNIATGLPSSSVAGQTLRSDGSGWLANSVLFNNGTNVGIGTTNPGQKLEVVGDIKGNNFIGNLYNFDVRTNNPLPNAIDYAFTTWFSTAGTSYAPSGLNHSSGFTVAGLNGAGRRRWQMAGDASISDFNKWYLRTGADSTWGTWRQVITDNGNGDVGIGTTTPGYKLDVAGDLNLNTYQIHGVGTPATGTDAVNVNYLKSSAFLNGGNSFGSKAFLGTNDNYALGFETYGTERMTISNNGNVGIGTDPGSFKLNVNGSLLVNTNTETTPFYVSRVGGTSEALGITVNDMATTFKYTNDETGNRINFILENTDTEGGGGVNANINTPLSLMGGTSGGFVGVNTTNPGAKLDVVGSLRASSATISLLGNSGNRIVMTDNAGNLYATSTNIATGLPSPSGINGQTLRSNGTNWIANNLLYNNGTNIGIGTTAPQSRLEVVSGTANTSADLSGTAGSFNAPTPTGQGSTLSIESNSAIAANTGGVLGFGGRYSGTGYANWASIKGLKSDGTAGNYGGYLSFWTRVSGQGNIERMRITDTGNVGIASTSPSTNLAIGNSLGFTGTGRIYGPLDYRYLDFSGALTDSLKLPGNIKLGDSAVNVALGLGANVANRASLTLNSTAGNPADIIFKNGSTSTGNYGQWALSSRNGSGNYRFSIWKGSENGGASTESEVFSISPNGNVGIGTSNPDRKFVISSSGYDARMMIDTNNTASYPGIEFRHNQDQLYRALIRSDYSSGSPDLTFWTSNVGTITQAMRITGNGNVGIGTTNPRNIFEVNGSNALINISNNVSNAGNIGIQFTHNIFGGSTERKTAIVSSAIGSYSRSDLNFILDSAADSNNYEVGTDTKMIIKNNGNVGIDTPTPDAKLNVNGTFHVSGAFNSVVLDKLTGTGNRIVMTDPDGSLYATSSSIASGMPTAGTLGQTLYSNGSSWTASTALYNNGTNIGIGTANPTTMLQIGNDATNPTILLESTGSGSEATVQSAGIEFGEVDYARGSLWYTGDGYMHIGMNNRTREHMRFSYSSLSTSLFGNLYLNGAANNTYFPGAGVWNSSGYVGIGTTTPGLPLNVIDKWQFTLGGNISSAENLFNLDLAGVMANSLKVKQNIYSTEGVLKTEGTGNNYMLGKLGIGTANPSAMLQISKGTNPFMTLPVFNIIPETNYGIKLQQYHFGSGYDYFLMQNNGTTADVNLLAFKGGNVGMGTTLPGFKLDVTGQINASAGLCIGGVCKTSWDNIIASSSSLVISGLNLSGGNITNVHKITVGTIDPLYRINGTNYSSFASAIVGGVKEEYLGRAKISQARGKEYEYRLDFAKLSAPDELWVWRQTVDFSPENVEVSLTPYGAFANIYYIIEDDAIILRADRPATVSYRLVGKRIDWQSWPTKAKDQQEKPSFIINNGKVIK